MDTIAVNNNVNVVAQVDKLVNDLARPGKTTLVIDFINSGEAILIPEFPNTEEGTRLRTNALQNARNERDALIRSGMETSVTLHLRKGTFVLINWDRVPEEQSIRLRAAGFRPNRTTGRVKSRTTKQFTEVSES